MAADLGKPGYVFRIDPDTVPCFKRRRLVNGESVLSATPAFQGLMAEVVESWTTVAGVVPDCVVVKKFSASPA